MPPPPVLRAGAVEVEAVASRLEAMPPKIQRVPCGGVFPCSGFDGAPFIYRAAETVHCHTLKTWVHNQRHPTPPRHGSSLGNECAALNRAKWGIWSQITGSREPPRNYLGTPPRAVPALNYSVGYTFHVPYTTKTLANIG